MYLGKTRPSERLYSPQRHSLDLQVSVGDTQSTQAAGIHPAASGLSWRACCSPSFDPHDVDSLRTVVLRAEHISDWRACKSTVLGPSLVADSIGPGLGPDNCISNTFPGDIDAADPVGWPAFGFAQNSRGFPGPGDFQC